MLELIQEGFKLMIYESLAGLAFVIVATPVMYGVTRAALYIKKCKEERKNKKK